MILGDTPDLWGGGGGGGISVLSFVIYVLSIYCCCPHYQITCFSYEGKMTTKMTITMTFVDVFLCNHNHIQTLGKISVGILIMTPYLGPDIKRGHQVFTNPTLIAVLFLTILVEWNNNNNNNNKVLFSLKHITFVNEKKWGVIMHVDI